MIAQISGKILFKSPTSSVIDCQGVGYEIFHTPFTAEKMIGETASLFIHSHIREDAFQLFGFSSAEERAIFKELLRVGGIGPKIALSILSGIPHEELLSALSGKDTARLQKIPGVGKKTAERLAIELSDRLNQMKVYHAESRSASSTKESELESILSNLGYQRAEILRAVKTVKDKRSGIDGDSLETLVKYTLKELTQAKSL